MAEQVPIKKFDKIDVPMLTEDYDRSLLLFRRKVGWSLEDLLYLPLKSHSSDKAMQEALGGLKAVLLHPESLTPDSPPGAGEVSAAAAFIARCLEGSEKQVYELAKKKFQQQWNDVPQRHKDQLTRDLARFQAALMELSTCCAEHEDDAYCQLLSEDNILWNE
eukprot:921561-Amphidinium_carterae.1